MKRIIQLFTCLFICFSGLQDIANAANWAEYSLNIASAQVKEDGFIDLTAPKRRKHILYGDATGGGHKYGMGIPGKSEFPKEWGDDKIIHEISSIAIDPDIPERTQANGRIVKEGTKDGIRIRVVLEPKAKGRKIITGFPINTPRNPK